ncbi:Uncharacterized protein Adt_27015 [Abeliophyllum distichum]|uniref:Uncharacterized protein n=1 Tax=Abeliophyllum distichum TaxID=126358 RepID=A0ABD1RSJ2_9LAMI
MNDVNKKILDEHGMMSNYKVWQLHGEKFETTPTPKTTIHTIDGEGSDGSEGGDHDFIIDMLKDRFKRPVVDKVIDGVVDEIDGLSSDGAAAAQFYKLAEESKEPFYLGCKNYTKLSFLFKLWHL